MMGTERRDTGVSQHRCFRLVSLLYHLSRSIQIYPELNVTSYLYINIETFGWRFQTFLFSIVYGIILPIDFHIFKIVKTTNHRIGLWENLQESPIFDGKNHGFL